MKRRRFADPAAKLMKLGQAKSLGMLDNDDAGLRHIHADLDNRGRHQKLCRAVAKALHGIVALAGFHLAMRQRHFGVRQGAGQRRLPVFGGGHIKLFRSSTSGQIQ